MRVKDNEFPVVVQAYDTRDAEDRFVAEQVVSNQTEIDHFTSRYAGKLIKVRALSQTELRHDHYHGADSSPARRRNSAAGVWLLLLLVVVALVITGFATGWIQRTFGLNVNF
ncbi:MAG TPA: hypothetical protein VD996_00710 [Chitinophagaceae bacterium]|nr:hypothetical protein [Chitinophagaceae bacterium]